MQCLPSWQGAKAFSGACCEYAELTVLLEGHFSPALPGGAGGGLKVTVYLAKLFFNLFMGWWEV